jgi:hypothetical protein
VYIKQTGPSRGRVLNGSNNNWLLGWWEGSKVSPLRLGFTRKQEFQQTICYVSGTGSQRHLFFEKGKTISQNGGKYLTN